MIDARIHMPGEFVCTKFFGLDFRPVDKRQSCRRVKVSAGHDGTQGFHQQPHLRFRIA
jgi:hypothetical protein